MKTHTSDYKNNVKLFGRELDSVVTYTLNNQSIELGNDNLNSITPHYEGSILKSVMKQLDIDCDREIPEGTVLNYTFGVKVRDAEVEDYRDNYDYVDFGNYVVYKSEKQEDTNSWLITCYDKMLYAMKDYESLGVTYPITVRSYINALCSKIGLTFKNVGGTFANYDKQIPSELYLDSQGNTLGYTYRDVLDELAQVTASTICINESDDQLEIRYINPTADIINEEYLKDINVNFGESYGPVNTIVLSRAGGSDKVYKSYPEDLPDDEKFAIEIADNQIMNFNDRDTYLPDILNKLLGLEYYLNDFSSTGITYYNLCDRYSVQIGENEYSCVMFNDEVNITQGLEEHIYTDMPEETETDYTKADKTDRRINQTYIIVDKQNGTINSVVSQTIDTSNPDSAVNQVSRLNGRVDTLENEIGNITGMVTTMDSVLGTVTFTDTTTQSEPITIKVYPITQNISYDYPHNDYPQDDYSKIRTIRFHNNDTNENFDYELPDDLLYYDSEHYDEFYLDLNSETCQIIKRCKWNADGTVGLLSSETTVSYTYPLLQLTEGIYTVSILSYNSGYILATLMAKNIYTDQFYTKVETDSLINQTAEQIELNVNQTLTGYSTTAQMNSAINIKANEITSSVSETYATKTTTNQLSSRISQTAKDISLTVNNGSTSSGIVIGITKEDGTTDQATGTIEMNGLVKFTNLYDGTTTISGSNIKTGAIDASQVNVTNLNADNITFGSISGSLISANSISANKLNIGSISSISANLGTITSGQINADRAKLDLNGGYLQVFNEYGGSMILSNAARLSATAGVGISSNSSGTISAPSRNLDLKACSGATAYLACMNDVYGESENTAVRCTNGILKFYSNQGYCTYNDTPVFGSSSKATKENIVDLTEDQKSEVVELLENIPLKQYDYKKQYGKPFNYGFVIEDVEDTKLKDLLHITQCEANKDIKMYSTEDLARLELIVIQELIKKNKDLEYRLSQLEAKESDK